MIYELPDRIGFSLRFFSLTHGTKGATKMRKLLTAGIFGTILGIVSTGTANASIVSSGFLDEKLTEYALSTSLDLKANQSDFIELNTQISDSVDNLKSLWGAEIGDLAYGFNPNKVNNNINGAFDLVEGFIHHSMLSLTNGWYESRDNFYQGIRQLNDGWTDSNDGTTYLGVIGLNDKIGTLPEVITVQGMYEGWTDRGGNYFPGLYSYSKGETLLLNAYNSESVPLLIQGARATTIDGVDYTGPVYPLWKLSEGIDKIDSIETKIGDLPTEIPNMVSTWTKYGFVENPGTPIDLPDTIGGMFAMLFNEDTSYNGLSLGNIMGKILMGFDAIGSRIEGLANLTSLYNLRGDSPIVTAVNANTAKIGTVPDGKNLAGMISETDAKIGTLPTEYATVGAALTAIKGIAEDAKAAALAAIPDPKQEGSSGKFVLTVDIVGDNATYHWEKIDREGETTTE